MIVIEFLGGGIAAIYARSCKMVFMMGIDRVIGNTLIGSNSMVGTFGNYSRGKREMA